MRQIVTVVMLFAIILQHSFITDLQSVLLSKTNHQSLFPKIRGSQPVFFEQNDQHTAVIGQHG